MQFSKPVVELIKTRVSCRSYRDTPIEDEKRQIIEQNLQSFRSGPFGGQARFGFISFEGIYPKDKKPLGTYGIIKGARYFIVGAIQKSINDLEDFGYLFEEIILLATDLGLGTIWLGGTFKKSTFASYINLKHEEILPAVSPIGYAAENPHFVDSVIKWAIKARKRKPWSELFFDDDFNTPLVKEVAASYTIPLEMVRLGPSARNKQPWRIVKVKDTNTFHFYIHQKGKRKQGERGQNFQRLDCGIAMCHFALTARELGLEGTWSKKKPRVDSLLDTMEYIISWVGK